MRIAIVGAGIAGLSAAYDLARAGQQVTIFEAAPVAGGLASGFRDPRWQWPLERFYHHLFETDRAMLDLLNEVGLRNQLFFRSQITAQWWQGRSYDLNGPLQVMRFPAMSLSARLRFGFTVAYLKYLTNDWRSLEQTTAATWTRRWMGQQAYTNLIGPLLEGKFGPYANEVNMAWLWARFKARSFRLGYFTGGFQSFADALLAVVERLGVTCHLQTPIQGLSQDDTGWQLTSPINEAIFDAVLVTGSPILLSRLVPTLPSSYLARIAELRSMGAVVMTIALTHPLTNGLYWMNMPKDQFPFLALVEHTNFIDRKHYGGDHLVYCGDYLEPSHEYFQLSRDELLERFVPALKRVNPAFERSWVRDAWLHREAYAQPIVPVGHSRNIPPIATPLPNLYWASMSQVYPWDRGTNFAVELGRQAASEILARPA